MQVKSLMMKRKFGTTESPLRGILCTRLTMNRGRKDSISQSRLSSTAAQTSRREADGRVCGQMWLDCLAHCLGVGGRAPQASAEGSILLGRRCPQPERRPEQLLATWCRDPWGRGTCCMTPQGGHRPNPHGRVFLNSHVGHFPGPTPPSFQQGGWEGRGCSKSKWT